VLSESSLTLCDRTSQDVEAASCEEKIVLLLSVDSEDVCNLAYSSEIKKILDLTKINNVYLLYRCSQTQKYKLLFLKLVPNRWKSLYSFRLPNRGQSMFIR